MHGGLFEVTLLGDELIELGEQGIDIREGGGDGALFGVAWKRNLEGFNSEPEPQVGS